MQAVILVGGKGTRLYSVVNDRPKCMADVNGQPFLKYLIHYLLEWTIDDILLCAGYKADYIQSHLSELEVGDVSLRLSIEDKPLGTAGALKKAEPLLDDRFIVLNGDTFCDIDLFQLEDTHGRSGDFDVTFALCPTGPRFSIFIYSGICMMERRALEMIPYMFSDLEIDLFPRLVSEDRTRSMITNRRVIDIGTSGGLDTAKRLFP